MDEQFHNLKFQKRKFKVLAERTFGPDDAKKVLAALTFAEKRHQGQRRDEGTAYLIHPLRVASTLLEEVGTWDADVVCGALLHDVVEDCAVRLQTIKKQFGKRVALFVDELTRRRRTGETEQEKERSKKEKLSKLRRAPLEVRLIKCADILDNLRCAAEVSWWKWTQLARKKFPRWHREFQFAAKFAKEVHPVLFKEISKALRAFEIKRLMRGLVRWKL